jgi:hypothetical protein
LVFNRRAFGGSNLFFSLRIVNGKMVEGWQNWDMLGMLEQIRGGDKSATYIAST